MKTKVEQPAGNGDWKGYVNWSASQAEKARVAVYVDDPLWFEGDAIHNLVESGYSVSFAYDVMSKGIRIAVTGKTVPCPNIGYTLSIRASSVKRAVGLADYYCRIICESGDWLVDKQQEDVW